MLTQNKIKARPAICKPGFFFMPMTLFPRPSPLGRRRKQESLKSNADNYLNLEYLHVDADILIVFMQDVLMLVYVWNLNVVEHRNMFLKREESVWITVK